MLSGTWWFLECPLQSQELGSMSLTGPFKLSIFYDNSLMLFILLMTGPKCKARMTCYFALLQCPTQTLYSGSRQTFYSISSPRHGTEPLHMSCYPLHRRTEETEEQEKHNYVHLCTACLSVWLYFSNASWLSKQHNNILCKNLLVYDLRKGKGKESNKKK